MYYNVLNVKKLADSESPVERKLLMEHDNSNFSIISIKKDEIIDTHTSTCDAAVYVIDGKIELHFDAEKFELGKGDLLMFKKDEQHKVLALKDSKFFLIKI